MQVQYKGDDEGQYTSFIETEKVRRACPNPTLDVAGLRQHEQKIPQHLQEFCTKETLERLRTMSDPHMDCASVNPAGTKLTLVVSPLRAMLPSRYPVTSLMPSSSSHLLSCVSILCVCALCVCSHSDALLPACPPVTSRGARMPWMMAWPI